ncbi:DUF4406 domain-containing protein [Ruminiclostridium josui]|jgi:hypothetical protein|uniref:DUF7768 domain-containing protein n=1 Tax=Ruminiclostridium josui TaxID=1499 RepID=UPI000467590D|nr:DUF4406 domain-containing protein [Ruminiclostridium josui]
MKLVYICSPYAGNIENNVRFARAACLYAAEHGCAPVTVHLLYPQFLDDNVNAQRELGIRMGLRVLSSCDELWICGERISYGMSCEIAEAERLGIPLRNLSTEQIQEKCHMEILPHYSKERKIMPEEAPSPGMKLKL